MKNFLLAVLLFVGGGTFAYAGQCNVPMQIIKEGPGGDIGTYAPARPWSVIGTGTWGKMVQLRVIPRRLSPRLFHYN